MEMTIKSKTDIETISGTEKPVFNFWAPDGGGYVRLVIDGKPGILGQQICDGGGFMGPTISCSPENFKRACRNWYRQYMRAAKREY